MSDLVFEIIGRRTTRARGLIADRSADLSVAAQGHERMGALLEALGNPQYASRTVHVAGSKGKGTTAHLTAALLSASGLRTGLYTSPHLLRWNERIAMDGAAISDADLVAVLDRVDNAMTRIEAEQPHFGPFNAFELLTGAAMLYFRESGCDAAVIEVGLGGRFDSTNNLHPAVTVITTIEREHIDVLGPDLRTIAWNKAGIIRPGVPVVVQRQEPEALDVLQAEANLLGASILLEGRDWTITDGHPAVLTGPAGVIDGIELALPGSRNAANLAAAVVSAREANAPDVITADTIRTVAASIAIPGRFTLVRHRKTGQRFLLDGAHTSTSLRELWIAVRERFGSASPVWALAFLDDKPWAELLTELAPRAERMLFPQVDHPRAVLAEHLNRVAQQLGAQAEIVSIDQLAGMTVPDETPIVATGTFALVSALLAHGDLAGMGDS
ncbi:MAG: Mur ligase family protein [Chloroflexota bacterium]|nr:Mur ligase family protein [Chloroflexota bacterium]